MSERGFSNFQDVARRSGGRPIVLFGAGNIAAKTERKLKAIAGIVDNNPNIQGTEQLGVVIEPPANLAGRQPKPFVLICSTSFREIGEQLQSLGFEPERDFLISPILNDLRVIADLESHRARLLFTSGLPPQDDPRHGGGLYELVLDGDDWSYRKIHSGNCHGLLLQGERILVVDDRLGVVEFDPDYRQVRAGELPQGIRAHGLAWSEQLERYFVACSYADKILVLDPDFRIQGELAVSHKHGRDGDPHHHCNDVFADGSSVYLSMFSLTGNWKRNVFDGAVLEFDAVTGEKVGPVIADLWMPHNVDMVDGSLVVLDSLRGRLLKNNAQSVGEFPAFSRGLAHDGQFFYVGQSRNRNFSSVLGISKNISIDTAIVLFDEYTKTSRSLQLPSRLSEIHSIAVLDTVTP